MKTMKKSSLTYFLFSLFSIVSSVSNASTTTGCPDLSGVYEYGITPTHHLANGKAIEVFKKAGQITYQVTSYHRFEGSDLPRGKITDVYEVNSRTTEDTGQMGKVEITVSCKNNRLVIIDSTIFGASATTYHLDADGNLLLTFGDFENGSIKNSRSIRFFRRQN